MKRRQFLTQSLKGILGVYGATALSCSKFKAKQPNIVLFLVDDMGWQDTSEPFYKKSTLFNELYKTPTMQRLADQGMKFTNAYAHQVCSPTRVSIMTGQNPARHHVTQWTLRVGKDPSGKGPGLKSPPWKIEGLQPNGATLPGILQQEGYRTIHVGKAHFGADGTPGEDPRNQGFDVNIAGHCAGGPGSFHGDKNFSAAWRNGDRIWDVPGLDQYHGQKIHLTEALTIEANKEVERAVNENKPFYLYMAHYAVHVPLEEDRRFFQDYLDDGVNYNESKYASMIESMDHSLGQIIKKLEDLNVAEDTIILFASDNGGFSIINNSECCSRGPTPYGTGSYTHNQPLKSAKGSGYEGGIRVPMIVSWAKPNTQNPHQQRIPVPKDSVCKGLVMVDDFLPTICRWAGVQDIRKYTSILDGYDFTGYLLQKKDYQRPGELIFHFPHFYNYRDSTIPMGYGAFSAMRKDNWKILHFYDRKKWELYDLETDIGEENDLAQIKPEVLKQLANRLVQRLKELGAQYPVDIETEQQVEIQLPA